MARAWTADEDRLLTERVAAGDTAAMIAKQITGRSVSSVVGRCDRLDLKLGETRPRAAPPKRWAKGDYVPPPSDVPRNIPFTPTTFACQNVTLLALGSQQCKWPLNQVDAIGEGDRKILLGEYRFCGNWVSDDGPYCGTHANWSRGIGTVAERRALSGIKEDA